MAIRGAQGEPVDTADPLDLTTRATRASEDRQRARDLIDEAHAALRSPAVGPLADRAHHASVLADMASTLERLADGEDPSR